MRKRFALSATAAVGLLAPVIGIAGPANAVTCDLAAKYTSTNIANSTKFDATSACDGVYAVDVATASDYVRGRFYKDGTWQTSSFGWAWIVNDDYTIDKIIGDTVTGRDIKGQGRNHDQYVSYLY